MNIIIKKFGGTSVSSIDRIERAISYVKKARKAGYYVIVVVSAMGKETDRLLKLTAGLDDYKKTFFKKIKLKYIVLCEKLKVGEVNALGFANPEMETILLNINTNDDDFERVIHHEIFHIIENNYKKFFPDSVWAKFNNPSFYYSRSSTNPEAYSLAKLNNTNGFFSEYAKYSISEDMAETFSFINSREKYVSEAINLDKILNKKVIFIKEGISNIEKSL